ncbi:MAG: hypothetical protein KKH08_00815 [Candidatus Omnitrophica bacterium]|nr:hypothetical protein [Candidatus Omnitrophota bacterium]
MPTWIIKATNRYEKDYKDYEKKRPNELIAVLNNLDTYCNALMKLGHPLQIKAGFIHHEPKGIKAIDQKGGKQKVKLEQTRLYMYPDCENKILRLLTIGNKSSQKRDIKHCLDNI